mgnify:CR=1 FL=1
MTAPITSELVRRAQARNLCPDVVSTLAELGAAVDAGVIELADLLTLARSCSTAGELSDALTMVATSINGMLEQELEVAIWTR